LGKDLRGKELGTGICQQANGMYLARFTDRFGKRRSKRFTKLQESRKWLADEMYLNEHGSIDACQDVTVDTWFEYWISMKKKTVRYSTVTNHINRYTANIKDVIGNRLVSEVKPVHCQQIFTRMADQGYKSSSMHITKETLHGLLEFAVENDLIATNPCKRSVKTNIGVSSAPKEALTIPEQRAFVEMVRATKYGNQFLFALQTGLRVGEIIGLQWKDVNFKKRTVTVSRTMKYWYDKEDPGWLVGEPKTVHGYRTIPLTDEAIRILKSQREKNAKIPVIGMEWRDQVFLGDNGQPPREMVYYHALTEMCKANGMRSVTMHILRHTFATRCIEAGMIPKTLQKILGHSSINITMNLYVHITEDEKNKEMEMVQDALMVI
jgi:integrase